MTNKESGALHDAAIKGDVVGLSSLLDAGADVNARYGDGTPLMMAATAGRAAIVRVLLERGADVEAVDDTDSTALHWATRYGLQEEELNGGVSVMRLLLENGADANCTDEMGDTPLMLAAQEGNAKAIHLLLDYGADIHKATEYGSTALHAAMSSEYEVVQVLIDAGADVNARGAQGWTPLRSAVYNQDAEGVKLLLAAGASVDDKDEAGKSLPDFAKEQGERYYH